MKKFLISSVIFFIPILVFLFTLEVITGFVPNSYSYKYNYVKKHGSEIKALAIGHSQLYDGFKAESFYLPAFNLCNSGQTFVDNYYLLCELMEYMPNLEVVIMPISYFSVTTKAKAENITFTDRSCYYQKYMNIDYGGSLPMFYWFECLDTKRAVMKVLSFYLNKIDIVGCDSLGRRSTHYLRDRQYKLGHDKIIEKETLREYDVSNYCISEEFYLLETIKLLAKTHTILLLVTPPYYWDCGFEGVNKQQIKFIVDYMNNLSKNFPVYYINVGYNSSFIYDDFYNETHLSEFGAEKFTQILNNEIRDILGSHINKNDTQPK